MKNYTIFAGVNGAGKTSIYKSIYYNENKDEKRHRKKILWFFKEFKWSN